MKPKNNLKYIATPAKIFMTVLIVLIAVSILQGIILEIERTFAHAKQRPATTKPEAELTQEEKRLNRAQFDKYDLHGKPKDYLTDKEIKLFLNYVRTINPELTKDALDRKNEFFSKIEDNVAGCARHRYHRLDFCNFAHLLFGAQAGIDVDFIVRSIENVPRHPAGRYPETPEKRPHRTAAVALVVLVLPTVRLVEHLEYLCEHIAFGKGHMSDINIGILLDITFAFKGRVVLQGAAQIVGRENNRQAIV
ncbi:MAG: hypothetical protein IIB56_10990 [Planctomycetes bacterium]|nr:hypothetical protein [Planctomycetota bacterium]